MELNELTLYLITRLNSLDSLLNVFSFLSIIAAILSGGLMTLLCFIYKSHQNRDKNEVTDAQFNYYKKVFTSILVGAVLIVTASVATPSQSEAAIIFGVPYVLRHQKEALESLNKTPKKLVELMNAALDKEIKKMSDDGKPVVSHSSKEE